MAHAIVNPDREQLIQCPYDPVHMISQMRFPYHLIKCRKNHNGKEYQQCPFDAKHVIIKARFEDHLRLCDKRAIIEPQLVLDDNRNEGLAIPDSQAFEIEQTLSNDWDTEAPTAAFLKTHRTVTQTVHNTFTSIDNGYRNDVSRSRSQSSTSQNNNYNTYNPQKSYGRGRAMFKNLDNDFSLLNADMGPGSYRLESAPENIDSYNPPPMQSFGRGRGQPSYAAEPTLRRPGQSYSKQTYKSGVGMKETMEKERQKLHKKIREIKGLEDRLDRGEALEQNQVDKIGTLNSIQSELNLLCKQIEKL